MRHRAYSVIPSLCPPRRKLASFLWTKKSWSIAAPAFFLATDCLQRDFEIFFRAFFQCLCSNFCTNLRDDRLDLRIAPPGLALIIRCFLDRSKGLLDRDRFDTSNCFGQFTKTRPALAFATSSAPDIRFQVVQDF